MSGTDDDTDYALDLLLSLDGKGYEHTAGGYVIEFSAKQVRPTSGQPHGIDYALVLRPTGGGDPWVRFDNAHSVGKPGRGFKKVPDEWDHRHQDGNGALKPYKFAGVPKLLDDFWAEVKKVLNEKGLPHDL